MLDHFKVVTSNIEDLVEVSVNCYGETVYIEDQKGNYCLLTFQEFEAVIKFYELVKNANNEKK